MLYFIQIARNQAFVCEGFVRAPVTLTIRLQSPTHLKAVHLGLAVGMFNRTNALSVSHINRTNALSVSHINRTNALKC